MNTQKAPVVACPHCGKEHVWSTDNKYRPFCCERCKMIDLGKWANEEYRVEQRGTDLNQAEDYQG